jgi:hypothetical protein
MSIASTKRAVRGSAQDYGADLPAFEATADYSHPVEQVLNKVGGGPTSSETLEQSQSVHELSELTAKALTERIDLPLLWSEQERAVGLD